MRSWPDTPRPDLPATGPDHTITVRDSGSGALRRVGSPKRAALYVCGITPYDATHLGHAATYVAFDLLVRAWLDAGYPVTYAQNVTDIDDPLLERAGERGEDWRELAERETELFRRDMTALRVLPPSAYVGAVAAIPQAVQAVESLLAQGLAYRVGADADGAGAGDVYGRSQLDHLLGQDTGVGDPQEQLARFAEMGGDPQRPGKEHPLDPLLWRMAREGEPSWEGGDMGAGRPGWHIECAVIAATELGAPYDVQGGGRDLAFPHHAMSASHLRALSRTPRPAAAHAHAGMVGFEGHKMSKSRGNLVLVSRLLADGVDPMAVRLVLLAHHYREDWEYTPEQLTAAGQRLALWRRAFALPAASAAAPPAQEVLAQVREALGADLDAPRALAVVDSWAQAALTDTDAAAPDPADPDAAAPALVRDAVDALLGVV